MNSRTELAVEALGLAKAFGQIRAVDGVDRPRSRADLPAVGVFADRGPRRPNRVGATICEIISVSGRQLRVRGLDAVDGTPVLDLKPGMAEFLPGPVHQPPWARKLTRDYFRP